MSQELEKLTLKQKWDNFLDFVDAPAKARLLDCDCKEGLEQYRYLRTEIENALKEKEEQDQIIKVIQEIIAFDQKLPAYNIRDNEFDFLGVVAMQIQREIENKERELLRNWVLKTCFPKELKAFEIIKRKKVDVDLLNTVMKDEFLIDKLVGYNMWEINTPKNKLTKKEFDLLREVLDPDKRIDE